MSAQRPTLPILDRRVRVALVGCGRIAGTHLAALAQHADHAALVAVCDSDAHALAAIAPGMSVSRYASIESMLAQQPAIDLVVLATPSGLHAPQALQVAAAGMHVLSEKPMATRWQEGLVMVRACEAAGVKLFVVKQNRLNPTLLRLKGAIDQQRFGRLAMAVVNVFWTRPQAYYDAAPWRGTWALDGGAFMNQASHYVDMVSWLMGPVARVHARAATLARRIESEDTGVMSLELASGALASINVTMLTHGQNFEGSITVLGEQGTVRIGGVAANQIQHWSFAQPHDDDHEVESASYLPASVYGHGHVGVYRQVLASLRGDASLAVDVVDGHEGLKSLELLIAGYRSVRETRSVDLPLER